MPLQIRAGFDIVPTRRAQHRRHRFALVEAVLERSQPPGASAPPRRARSADRLEPARPGDERRARLEAQIALRRVRIAGGEVRRIRDDDVEASPRRARRTSRPRANPIARRGVRRSRARPRAPPPKRRPPRPPRRALLSRSRPRSRPSRCRDRPFARRGGARSSASSTSSSVSGRGISTAGRYREARGRRTRARR